MKNEDCYRPRSLPQVEKNTCITCKYLHKEEENDGKTWELPRFMWRCKAKHQKISLISGVNKGKFIFEFLEKDFYPHEIFDISKFTRSRPFSGPEPTSPFIVRRKKLSDPDYCPHWQALGFEESVGDAQFCHNCENFSHNSCLALDIGNVSPVTGAPCYVFHKISGPEFPVTAEFVRAIVLEDAPICPQFSSKKSNITKYEEQEKLQASWWMRMLRLLSKLFEGGK